MYAYTWYQWILFFFTYCFIGWMIESTYVSAKSGHFVNRGFLRLPLLPLYGSGAIIMLWASLPVQNNLILVFLSGMVGASVLEYVTGYVMERLFKMKYWDYTNNPFNINGYVCLGTSIAWGFLTIVLTEFIHRPVERMILRLAPLPAIILVLLISAAFIDDTIRSTKAALDLGRVLESLTKMKAELEEVQLQIALLKAETSQKVSDLRDETTTKLVELRAATVLRRSETINAFKESVGSRHEAVQRALLRRNPTASSRQFAEALKELKEYSQTRKERGSSGRREN